MRLRGIVSSFITGSTAGIVIGLRMARSRQPGDIQGCIPVRLGLGSFRACVTCLGERTPRLRGEGIKLW